MSVTNPAKQTRTVPITPMEKDVAFGQELDEHLQHSSLAGKPVHIASKAFRLESGAEERAMVSGPPAWMLRLKRIERWKANAPKVLKEKWQHCCETIPSPGNRRASWHHSINSLNLKFVNQWIENHNEYYPIELDLPFSRELGRIMDRDGKPFQKIAAIDTQWLWDNSPEQSHYLR